MNRPVNASVVLRLANKYTLDVPVDKVFFMITSRASFLVIKTYCAKKNDVKCKNDGARTLMYK